jgi:hypothetical protein
MGDRRMAEIRTSDGSLYFYTHHTGLRLPEDAARALALASPRQRDEPYALRRIVDHLILASGSRDQETNSGLMLTPCSEDEYGGDPCSVLIDIPNWKVSVATEYTDFRTSTRTFYARAVVPSADEETEEGGDAKAN